MKRLNIILAALILAGCGDGDRAKSGGSAPPPPPPPPPPAVVLTGVSVAPTTATIAVGATQSFAATGTFSDGSSSTVSVTWTASSAAATIDAAGLATGISAGDVTITATAVGNPAISGTAMLKVRVPVVYGVDAGQGVVRYPMSGGAPTVVPLTGSLPIWAAVSGITYHDDQLYLLQTGPTGASLYRANLVTNVVSFLAAYPIAVNHYGLGTDSLGRVYASSTGSIYRYDPSSGGLSFWAGSGVALSYDLLVDATDSVFVLDFLPGGGLVVGRVTSGGAATGVANAPAGFFTSGGLARTAAGTVYFAESTNGLYRAADLNGDGDCFDAGEVALVSGPYDALSGVLAIPTGILVNEQNWFGTATAGIYRLADLNGDGDFQDAGEKTLWSADTVSNDVGPDVMTTGYQP